MMINDNDYNGDVTTTIISRLKKTRTGASVGYNARVHLPKEAVSPGDEFSSSFLKVSYPINITVFFAP